MGLPLAKRAHFLINIKTEKNTPSRISAHFREVFLSAISVLYEQYVSGKTDKTFLFPCVPDALFCSCWNCNCAAGTSGWYIQIARILSYQSLTIKQKRDYPNISEMTPAPTVCPPSRMANLSSFSMAIGVISSAVTVTESPGMTISTSLGSWMTPVTSVVLK